MPSKNLTQKQIRKLENLDKVANGGELALLNLVHSLEDRVEKEINELADKIPNINEVINRVHNGIDGVKGDKGDKGERGEKGDIGPQGIKGEKGTDSNIAGPKGDKGDKGDAGKDGVDGKDGEMGIVDEATIAYLEDEIKRVEDKIGETFIEKTKETNFGFVIRDVVAGTNVTIDNTDPNRPIINAIASSADTFETVSKNLDASGATLSYTGDELTSIAYVNGITKTLNYTGDNLTSVVLSGSTPAGIDLTKTLSYTGDDLTDVIYS